LKYLTKPRSPVGYCLLAAIMVLTMLGASGIGQAQASTSSSPGAATSCPEVFLIGARGSGQTAGGKFHGLGPEVSKMISVAQDVLRDRKISTQTYAVNYPAYSTSLLNPGDSWLFGPLAVYDHIYNGLEKWYSGMNDGVSTLDRLMKTLNKRCPSAGMLLVGYSQGAMVVHSSWNAQVTRNNPVLPCLYGAVLLGDGYRVPSTKAKEFGTSPANGEGMVNWFLSVLHRKLDPDIKLHSLVANICDNHDFVCDTSLWDWEHWHTAAGVHSSYAYQTGNGTYAYLKVLTTAATWVAKKVASEVPDGTCGLS
jgi:hypothetical protein